MPYARPSPSPRPGDIYDPSGNAYSYARSEAGGVRPGRPPPQQLPTAGPSDRGASSRQGLRLYEDAGFDHHPRQSPRRPIYNNSSSKSSVGTDFDYHPYPSRPSAMNEDKSWYFRKPSSTARLHDTDTPHYPNGLPMRTARPRTAEDYLDSEETGQPLDGNQDTPEAQDSWSWNKIKKTVWGNTMADARNQPPSPEEDKVSEDAPPENQNTLWTKLATVGASFQKKIHADGYASDASDYQGESHLIRIMKKYYTEKVDSTHDLPDWLFSQAELKAAHSRTKSPTLAAPRRPERRPGSYEQKEEETDYRTGNPAGSGRGALSDIYDSVDQDRSNRSRNGSSAKQSFDSGYGSSSNTSRRPGRYDDSSRTEFTEIKPSLGRNRLPIDHDQAQRYHPGSNLHHPRRPINHTYPDDRSASIESRRLRNPPTRGPPYVSPTVLDHSRPSGQDDRYPIPKTKHLPSYAC